MSTSLVLPAIVPQLITTHASVIHDRARLLKVPAKLVITGFGEDPGQLDPKTGKLGLHLPPKIFQVRVGDMEGIANSVNQITQLPHYNPYMPLAAFRPDLAENAKGGEADVVACFGIVADFDDADAPRWAERLPIPPQYVLETSAGRFQAFYLFSKPEPLAAVKPVAERLKVFAGCDYGTSDMSHVWRIAGTLNWPNGKKVGEGRSPVPQQVKVVKRFDGSTISLEKLSEALPEGAAAAGGNAKARAKSSVRPKGLPHPATMLGTPEQISAFFATLMLPYDLQEEIKNPVEGDRSKALFRVIVRLIELGHDDQKIENIIHAHPEGIGAKYVNRNDLDQEIGRVRAKTGPQDAVSLMVQEMNETYAVVDDNGKTVVMYRQKDDDLLDRLFVVRASYQDFRNLYLNEKIWVSDSAGKSTLQTKANIWLNHPDRRTYKSGVRFLPGMSECPEGVFNLWTGWGVEPRGGDWSRMRAHIRDIICSGDPELFEYLMNWMAKAVQEPGIAGEVAVVLRGGRGTGKGMFARSFGNLFGPHFLHLSDARHLTGNFNAHLRDACLVVADEAFWAGDKQHEGQLKRLVTEPTLMIEAKHQNAVEVRNCLHVIVSSNEAWVVPAGTDERRFFVLDVSSSRKGDFPYFAAIEGEFRNGGAAAMLYDLQHRDLSNFNVRAVPNTGALLDQKKQSFDGPQAWWHNILLDGVCPAEEDQEQLYRPQDWEKSLRVSRDALYAHYEEFSNKKKEYRPKDKSQLGAILREFVPALKTVRPREGGDRKRLYILPPLAECRAAFEKYVGSSMDWEEG